MTVHRTKIIKVGLAALSLQLGVSSLPINTAYAQEVSLSSYPSLVQLQTKAQGDTRGGFTITNKSNKSINLRLALKPFKADTTNDGKLVYIEGNDPSIFKKIQVLDHDLPTNSIELGPHQSKQLQLQIANTENEAASDYYFSIIFLPQTPTAAEETKDEVTAQSIAQAGIAINVLLHVGPKETPNGKLKEFSTDQFRTSGPVPFTVTIENNGNQYFTPKGAILIKNIFNQTVGRIDLQNANILAGTSRSLIGTPYTKNAKEKSHFSAEKPQWPEKFLLGFYTAELSVALSEEGPVLTHAIRFLAIPVHVIGGILIIAIIITLIILRIRRKLKDL